MCDQWETNDSVRDWVVLLLLLPLLLYGVAGAGGRRLVFKRNVYSELWREMCDAGDFQWTQLLGHHFDWTLSFPTSFLLLHVTPAGLQLLFCFSIFACNFVFVFLLIRSFDQYVLNFTKRHKRKRRQIHSKKKYAKKEGVGGGGEK